MSSERVETFDSLRSDDETERKRTAKPRRRIGKRSIAWIVAAAVFVAAVAITVPVGLSIYNNRGVLKALSLLKDAYVDMEGVTAFGVWNVPDADSPAGRISNVVSVRSSVNASGGEDPDEKDSGIITGDWSDEERYDWESDYDWDPTKANVLIAIGEDGRIEEVVYERTNGRGQVRQDRLGNAAMVYVSDGFTYVMYINDEEWEWWLDHNFVQEMRYPNGFHCHHERMQTVVIHNATGKVFALKDVIPQVNELSGATNHTMQVQPYKNDFISIEPMYGNGIPQWYTVIYDEETEKIRYELMLPVDVAKRRYDTKYFVRAARRDRYGQQYLLENHNTTDDPRVTAGKVDLPTYTRYGNSIAFNKTNGIMFGSDERAYAFDEGKLKVFGENFELKPVEKDTQVTIEGIANEFFFYGKGNNEGIVYRLSGGWLYSMFGEVWKVDDDGAMHARENLKGEFPRYADDGWMLGGEIMAFVDTEQFDKYSVNGRIVDIRFENTDDAPRAIVTHILSANELSVQPNNRTVVWQNRNPLTPDRGETKYFLITAQDGKVNVNFFATGYDGGVDTLTKPITEPLTLT